MTEFAPGGTLAGFKIEAVLGRGGMATVYRAEQLSLRRKVALKVLSASLSSDPEFRERFKREGQMIAALEHPNIVTVYDSGEADGQLYFAMRLIEGENLSERLRTRGLSASGVTRMLAPIASALDAAHALGLVHRDVKPENILLNHDDVPFLADFGIARAGDSGLTSNGMFVGSISYASPEHILGSQLTAAADVYALAVVAYQCLAGQVPFKADSEVGVMRAHLEQDPPAVPNLPPLAAELNAVLAKAMAKEPRKRHPTAGELMREVELAVNKLSKEYLEGIPAFSVATRDPQVDELHRLTVRRDRDANKLSEVGGTSRSQCLGAADDEMPATPYTAVHSLRREPASDQDAAPAGHHAAIADERRSASRAVDVVRRSHRRGIVSGLVLAAVVGVGMVVAVSLGGSPTSVASAHSGPLSVRYSAPWVRPSAAGGTAPVAAKALRFVDGASVVVLGPLESSAEAPAGVPPALADSHGAPTSQGPGAFGGHPAVTYTWGSSLAAVVLATWSGDYAAVCTGSAARSACTMFAARSKLNAVAVLSPGTDHTVQAGLAAALAMAQPTAAQRAALARTGLTQRAAPLSSLAARVSHALVVAGRVRLPMRFDTSVRRLTAALGGERRALGQLERSAKANTPIAFDAALVRLRVAEAAVQMSLKALSGYGFTLHASSIDVAEGRRASSSAPDASSVPSAVTQSSPAVSGSSAPPNSSSSSQIVIQGGSS